MVKKISFIGRANIKNNILYFSGNRLICTIFKNVQRAHEKVFDLLEAFFWNKIGPTIPNNVKKILKTNLNWHNRSIVYGQSSNSFQQPHNNYNQPSSVTYTIANEEWSHHHRKKDYSYSRPTNTSKNLGLVNHQSNSTAYSDANPNEIIRRTNYQQGVNQITNASQDWGNVNQLTK